MTPERWQQIDKLLDEALDREPGQRKVFLEQACAGDEELHREVEALLAAHEKAGSFVEVPALNLAARALAQKQAQPLAGQRLGPYEILSLLGRGGMGEVYRVRDTRLDRMDALKILPPEVASDPDRLRRFIREAKAASALNHPNIATIYEIGESDGVHWIAMELVEGETLEAWIHVGRLPSPGVARHPQGGRGPGSVDFSLAPGRGRGSQGEGLNLNEILDIGIQVAEALEEAHDKGIIHRDLKPANLMITGKGQVKVLDFGLAKRIDSEGVSQSTASQTTPGLVMGTARYMSPEQVLNQAVDHRTDIFSLGVTLYEMATGEPPFAGETPTAIFDAIVHQAPAWPTRVQARIPEELRRIINKAMEKFREMRYARAVDLGADLKRLKRDAESGRAITPGAIAEPSYRSVKVDKTVRRWKWALAGVVLMLLIGIGATWFATRRAQPPPLELKETRLTANPSEYPVGVGGISPDGKLLAYSDPRGLYLKLIETGVVHAIPQPEGSTAENTNWYASWWFPDGTRFLAGRYETSGNYSTWVVSVVGGPPRLLRTNASPGPPSPDGSQIVFMKGIRTINWSPTELWLMGAQGEDPRKILSAPEGESLNWMVWSPDGQRIVYQRYHGGEVSIESRDLKGEQLSTIMSDPAFSPLGLWWFPNGRMVFANDDSLWEIQVEPKSGRTLGPPRRITKWPGFVVMVVNGTTDGKRLVVLKKSGQSDVFVGEWEARSHRLKNPRRLTLDEHDDAPGAWTRDSKAVLFSSERNGENGQFDIFRQALDQDTAEPVATGPGNKHDPVLSPDGNLILYLQDADEGKTRIMRVPSSGGAPEMVLEGKGIIGLKCSLSPATPCVLGEETPDRKQFIFTAFDPMKGRGRELTRVTLKKTVEDSFWDLTRDGSRLAFAHDVQGNERRIQILSLSSGKSRDVVIQHELHMKSLDWAIEGKGFFVGAIGPMVGVLFFVDLDGRTEILWKRATDWSGAYPRGLPSPDGRHLAVLGWTLYSNVSMLENF